MFSDDFTITKKQLGWFLLITGILGIIGILSIDVLDTGRDGGIGPAQLFALGLMVITSIIGATLIPLGDEPA